jgi:hypothetical protein
LQRRFGSTPIASALGSAQKPCEFNQLCVSSHFWQNSRLKSDFVTRNLLCMNNLKAGTGIEPVNPGLSEDCQLHGRHWVRNGASMACASWNEPTAPSIAEMARAGLRRSKRPASPARCRRTRLEPAFWSASQRRHSPLEAACISSKSSKPTREGM